MLKTLSQKCISKQDFAAFLSLIKSLKFTARDFRPMLKELDIFSTLYGIVGSEATIKEVFGQVLLRLDDEKDLSTDGLRRCVSRVDVTISNQLLGSQIAIVVSEIECYIALWTKIESGGLISKDSYQPLACRYTNDLLKKMPYPVTDPLIDSSQASVE